MKVKLSRRVLIYIGSIAACVTLVVFLLYLAAQHLLGNVVIAQLRQAGYPQARITGLRLYVDGVVIEHVYLDDKTQLHELYTPQSAPSVAQQGIEQLIIRSWEQNIPAFNKLTLHWPFPYLTRLSIEKMQLHLGLPLQPVMLEGTVKSLQPDAGNLVLLMPFAIDQDTYQLHGTMELNLAKGMIQTVDLNLEDGFYQSPSMALRRLNGWMNIQAMTPEKLQAEAQFTAGAAHYNGYDFADGMAQYSHFVGTEGQWTVTLNRQAQEYFNTWVIKPTTMADRYAIQIAAQQGAVTKTRTLVTGTPVRLDLLLPPQPQD
jgi:hypothetical protein